METLTTDDHDTNSGTDRLAGHVLGKVKAVEPSNGTGVKVIFINARGEQKTAYFAASGSIPKAGDELKFSAWVQPAGNVRFSRETTTEADLEGLIV